MWTSNVPCGTYVPMKSLNRTVSAEKRFWHRVKRSRKCWLWTGCKTAANGYGRIRIDGSKVSAHRYSWELHNGPIPAGMLVLHRCDVRACVRPDHLFLGTHSDNAKDCVAKGRSFTTRPEAQMARRKAGLAKRGENGPNAKLTWDAVRKMREQYASGLSAEKIGKLHNVSKTTALRAIKEQTWKEF